MSCPENANMLCCANRRGFYIVGILLVVVIICILSILHLNRSTGASMPAAGRAECLSNQKAFQAEVARWSMNHPNTPVTLENMQKAIPPVVIPKCRDGGTWTMDEGGQVYCSVHNPQPTPPPTPTPRPAIDFMATDTFDPDAVATPIPTPAQ